MVGELVPHALAEVVGYPRPRQRDGTDWPFLEFDRRHAAATLAMLETQSQAYGFNRPPAVALVDELEREIAALGPDARFFGNADHVTPQAPRGSGDFVVVRSVGSWPLSEATFDTGILGVGRTLAFIVWAEEED